MNFFLKAREFMGTLSSDNERVHEIEYYALDDQTVTKLLNIETFALFGSDSPRWVLVSRYWAVHHSPSDFDREGLVPIGEEIFRIAAQEASADLRRATIARLDSK